MDLPGFRAHEGIEVGPLEVGPLVAVVDCGNGPLSFECPHLPDHRLKAQAVLVLSPKLHVRFGVLLPEALYLEGETFLKASCSF